MEGVEVMIFMGLVLKIPVAFACWILWWAWKSQPDPAEAPPDEGGNDHPTRFRRRPKRPRGPRRGPHNPGSLPLPCPEESAIRVIRRRPSERLAPTGSHERHSRA